MPIPGYETVMLPLLQLAGDGKVHSKRDAIEQLANEFKLTQNERHDVLRSGQPTFANRVHWAAVYLVKAGLMERPERGKLRITARGRETLAESPPRIDDRFLMRFPEFVEFQTRKPRTEAAKAERSTPVADKRQQTPEEQLAEGYQELRDNLADELLEKVRSCTPQFFERLVLDLLLKMGYGGAVENAGKVTGRTGDGGIDGLIKEDKLGLDVIYVQAKRWEGTVPVSSVRDFAGSLDYHGARKGVFITTSDFTNDARQFVGKLGEKKIVLVNGFELAQLMIDHDIGVSPDITYVIKRLDTDYFEEE